MPSNKDNNLIQFPLNGAATGLAGEGLEGKINADKPSVARAVMAQGKVQAAAIIGKDIVNEAIRLHGLLPLAAAALGRGLMGAVLLGLNLKNQDSITLRIKGDGPLEGLLAQVRPDGQVRGYVGNPTVELPKNAQGKLDVGGAVGRNGFLYVTKDMGLKEPYTGTSALVSGEIAEDLAAYFLHSEQTPTVVSLGVMIDVDGSCLAAGGFLIKALPGADDATLEEMEHWLEVLPPVSSLALQLGDAAELLQALFPKEELQALTLENWTFSCDCSRQRMEKALISLGEQELKDILEEDGQTQLRCNFCNNTFDFSANDLAALLAAAKKRSDN